MKLFGIRFYNPWKPHIIVIGTGYYLIRVKIGVSWKYWDNAGDFYFSKIFASHFSSIEEVQKELKNAATYLIEHKSHRKKLHFSDKVVYLDEE